MVSTVQGGRWDRRSSGFRDSVWRSQSPSWIPFLREATEQDPTSHTFLPAVAVHGRLQITPRKPPSEDPTNHLLPGGGLSRTYTALVLAPEVRLLQWARKSGTAGKVTLLVDPATCLVAAICQSEATCFSQPRECLESPGEAPSKAQAPAKAPQPNDSFSSSLSPQSPEGKSQPPHNI